MLQIFSAENFLESIELNQNYPVLLLNIIGRDQIQMTVKVASAIAFKNFIKRNWSNVSCLLLIYNHF